MSHGPRPLLVDRVPQDTRSPSTRGPASVSQARKPSSRAAARQAAWRRGGLGGRLADSQAADPTLSGAKVANLARRAATSLPAVPGVVLTTAARRGRRRGPSSADRVDWQRAAEVARSPVPASACGRPSAVAHGVPTNHGPAERVSGVVAQRGARPGGVGHDVLLAAIASRSSGWLRPTVSFLGGCPSAGVPVRILVMAAPSRVSCSSRAAARASSWAR